MLKMTVDTYANKYMIQFYDWKKSLDEPPTLFEMRDKIEELNKMFIRDLTAAAWQKTNRDYFLRVAEFLTQTNAKIEKERLAKEKLESWLRA